MQGIPILQSDQDSIEPSFCGESLDVLSSDWTVSSGLQVNILTLKSGSELVASKANGVEFYFVVKGSGTFHRNDADFDVLAGYGWISDPGRYVNLLETVLYET